ncbi:TldD/PmbA family protein [Thermococcus thermotolerans]|uniref:TldD/PmbA family protein n=1 Tax=Thermococcus thermotolerans TaxID=2969672 RepID=UPI0021587458|nr:TldD/PmbA family protein [Thermococcus thermotolerans]
MDRLERALRWAEQLRAEYMELRFESVRLLTIDYRDDRLDAFSGSLREGIGVRVLADGAWGFSATSKFNNIERVIDEAYRLAKAAALTKKERIELAEIKPVRDFVKSQMKVKPSHVGLEEKVAHVGELGSLLYEDPAVKSVWIHYEDGSGRKILVTSEGTEIEWDYNYLFQMATAVGRSGNIVASAGDNIGGVDTGWEIFEMNPNDEVAGRILERLRPQFSAVRPKRGEWPVVLSPKFSALMAHEALGHPAEADLTQNSALEGILGQEIAPEFVNMSDGLIENGFGNDRYDDEGVPVEKVEILKNGILNELLVDREWAFRLGIEPNGHSRAEDYRNPPKIRMRNTFFEPGDWNFEEMIEDIGFGYYLVLPNGGQAQLNTAFQVGVALGYTIRNGELAEPIKDASITGIAVEAIKRISAVGDDFGSALGACGKGTQMVWVSSGGPHMRFDGGILMG